MDKELERLLKKKPPVAEGTKRNLQFYRLAVELEQLKEPSARDWFDMPWKSEPISVRFVDNNDFKEACKTDWQKKFPQDVSVALCVSDGSGRHPLFQCVHQHADIKDMDIDSENSVLRCPLTEFEVSHSIADGMDINEWQVDALNKYLHEGTPTLVGLEETLTDIIGEHVSLAKAICVALSSKNPVLSQLVSELKRLSEVGGLPEIVGNFLDNRGFDNRLTYVDPDSLVMLTSLDDAQRYAVAQALANKVTVVTGPPGCGKTQVILNLLANAVILGKSVLVSSKNNKAVDNVRDRLVKEPMLDNAIVRFGSREISAKAMNGLDALLEISQGLKDRRKSCAENLEAARVVHEKACRQMSVAKKQIAERAELNEKRSELEAVKNSSEEYLSETRVQVEREMEDYLADNVSYQVFEGFGLSELDNFIMQFRRLRNDFSRKYSGLGKIWIDWFTLRKHAASAIDVVMSFPGGIRQLVEGGTQYHAADDFKKGTDVVEYYRMVDSTLTAGLKYLDGKSKLEKNGKRKIESAQDAFDEAAENLSRCEARIAEIDLAHPEKKLSEAVATIHSIAAKYLSAALLLKLSNPSAPESIVDFRNYVKGNNTWMNEFGNVARAFVKVNPLVAITSLSAKGALPLEPELFDMLVIDEASQCDVASALPLMFRAKQIVIIGDPKQLKHISRNEVDEEKAIKEYLHLKNSAHLRYAEASLWDCTRDWLTRARYSNTPLMLNCHYRCHHDIIGYSNEMFYGQMGGLVVRTKPFANPIKEQGCHWVDVRGRQVSSKYKVNLQEIVKAVGIASDLAKKYPDITIGLVTPFKAQAEKMHAAIMNLSPDSLRERITASTVHKFQGDERDVMIYSPVVSDNSSQGSIDWIDEGAPNLVNVAVTRARQALYVVGDKNYIRKHSSLTRPLGALLNYIESR